MTGRIKTYSPTTGAGTIEAETGNQLTFKISDVLAFDRIGLKVGRVVGFIDEGRSPGQAFDVFVMADKSEFVAGNKPKLGENLRFAGFHYEKGFRLYSFEERFWGEETRRFVVEAEASLLLAHKVSLQEIPTLCREVLLNRIQTTSTVAANLERVRLTEAHIRQFGTRPAAPKPLATGFAARRRIPNPPSNPSNEPGQSQAIKSLS